MHSNRCSEVKYRLDSGVTRLTPKQTAEVMQFLRHGTLSNRIRLMARLEYQKYLTRSDVNNLKCQLIDTALPAGMVVCGFYMLAA